ncbi:hypothetical protein F4825DRAFT_457888 [Nemania diffusa]|nr:hypothetical protein F4825DRAFT_457888 [Nemania diffusa]
MSQSTNQSPDQFRDQSPDQSGDQSPDQVRDQPIDQVEDQLKGPPKTLSDPLDPPRTPSTS